MRTLLFATFFNLICLITFGQSELILHKGAEKESVTKGKIIGVTLKGEEFKFNDWKNVYKTNNAIRQNIRVIDSIGKDSIYISGYEYSPTFTSTVVLRTDMKSLFQNKDYIIDSIVPSKKGKPEYDKVYCRIVQLNKIGEKHDAINYNNIESLTFANNKDINTSGGGLDLDFSLKNIYHPDGHIHVGNGRSAAIALLVILSVGITYETVVLMVNEIENINDKIKNEVHTYSLKDWKIEIK